MLYCIHRKQLSRQHLSASRPPTSKSKLNGKEVIFMIQFTILAIPILIGFALWYLLENLDERSDR